MARPLKINDVKDTLMENIKQGVPIETAVTAAGIVESTYYNWKNKAEEAIKKGESNEYSEFLEELKKAEKEAEQKLVSEIFTEKQWQAKAWILERRFGYKEKKEHSVDVSLFDALTEDPPDESDSQKE